MIQFNLNLLTLLISLEILILDLDIDHYSKHQINIHLPNLLINLIIQLIMGN